MNIVIESALQAIETYRREETTSNAVDCWIRRWYPEVLPLGAWENWEMDTDLNYLRTHYEDGTGMPIPPFVAFGLRRNKNTCSEKNARVR